jgi:ATP-dependent DNA helicase RecG
MTGAWRDAGLAPPTLEEIGTRFRVTLWLEPIGAPTLDETEEAILGTLRDATSHRTRILRLVERGLVREVGTSPQDPSSGTFRRADFGGNVSEICLQI